MLQQIEEEQTWVMLKDKFLGCGDCGAPKSCLEVRLWSKEMNDGQIWCQKCNSYQGIWDGTIGFV